MPDTGFRERSLIGLLRDRAAAQPDDCAYTFLDDGERLGASITWGQLEQRSRAIATGILRSVEPGSRVFVMFPPSLDFVAAFFGVLYAGAIAVPVYPPTTGRADRTTARLRGMVTDAGAGLVLAPAEVIRHVAAIETLVPELSGIPWLDPAAVPDAVADEWRHPHTGADPIAFLQYTSGSTAAPRGVVISHRNLLHNLARTAADGAYGTDAVSVSWLPVNHDMGLINGVLQPVFNGYPAYLMSPAAFLHRPHRWLDAISRLGATHSGGPNFAFDLCASRVTADEAASLDLSGWRVAYNGSEPVRRSTMETFQRRFGSCGFRWDAFSPAYGLAESTLLVTSIPAGIAPVCDGEAVASGVVAPEDAISIVDPVTHEVLPQGRVGEVWISGGSVARGYWNRPDETRQTFRAHTADGAGPFLRSGDLGVVRDGHLFVTGRIKDLLIVRGAKHYPQDLELTAERAHAAVRPGCCAAFAVERDGEETIHIVAEVRAGAPGREGAVELPPVLAAIRLAITAVHHVAPHGVWLVRAGSVPKTTSGKLQRFQCRDALLAGMLDPIVSWTESPERFDEVAS